MAIERRLTEIAGPVAGRLHTARSRNDQVATDLAMYTRERARRARRRSAALMARCCSRAPGAHRLADARLHPPAARTACLPRPSPARLLLDVRSATARASRSPQREAGRLPLGAGALAGVNFDTDREWSPASSGSRRSLANSIDAVSGRDFVLDYLAAAATCSTHLSRLGAELVLWSSTEFGFCELPDAWSSGSSIMPQKKNPDAAELLRAKAPRVVGHLAALHGVPARAAADLQQGPAGGQGAPVRHGRHAGADAGRATGMIAGVAFDRERLAGGCL